MRRGVLMGKGCNHPMNLRQSLEDWIMGVSGVKETSRDDYFASVKDADLICQQMERWLHWQRYFGRFMKHRISYFDHNISRYDKVAALALGILSDMSSSSTDTWIEVGLSVVDLVIKKQKDYGISNLTRYQDDRRNEAAILVRLRDKTHRAMNLLTQRDHIPNFETLLDTIRDIVGYCMLGTAIRTGTIYLRLDEKVGSA